MKDIWNSIYRLFMGEDYIKEEAPEKESHESFSENPVKEEKRETRKMKTPSFTKKERHTSEEKERPSRYSDNGRESSYSFGSTSKAYDYDYAAKNKSRVVNMSSAGNQNTIITSIKEYSECKDIVRQLKERKAVIINVDHIDKITAKRVVDFLSGAITAIDGDIKKLSNSIVIVAPNNVKLTGMFGEDIPSNITETLFTND